MSWTLWFNWAFYLATTWLAHQPYTAHLPLPLPLSPPRHVSGLAKFCSFSTSLLELENFALAFSFLREVRVCVCDCVCLCVKVSVISSSMIRGMRRGNEVWRREKHTINHKIGKARPHANKINPHTTKAGTEKVAGGEGSMQEGVGVWGGGGLLLKEGSAILRLRLWLWLRFQELRRWWWWWDTHERKREGEREKGREGGGRDRKEEKWREKGELKRQSKGERMLSACLCTSGHVVAVGVCRRRWRHVGTSSSNPQPATSNQQQ